MRSAFTLLELLVVVAVIGVLAGLLWPALTKARQQAQGLQCLSNLRQLTLAWRMYTEDNDGRLLFSMPSWQRGGPNARYAWVMGQLDFDPYNRSNWDLETDIHKSPLWPYCGQSAAIWKCPADKSSVKYGDTTYPRVRSMSMNFWLGGLEGKVSSFMTVPEWQNWKVNLKLDDLVDPSPSRTFVFLDMREDGINSGSFLTDMTGSPDKPELLRFWHDYPATYHNRAGGFSFADGHSEIKRWRDPRTMPPMKKGVLLWDVVVPFVPSPNNPDLIWLQERATGLK